MCGTSDELNEITPKIKKKSNKSQFTSYNLKQLKRVTFLLKI
jgi:hypothetical protein